MITFLHYAKREDVCERVWQCWDRVMIDQAHVRAYTKRSSRRGDEMEKTGFTSLPAPSWEG